MEFDYFEGRPRDAAMEHRRRINLQIHERFRIRDNNNPLNMAITEFGRIYRMPQDAVVRLCNILRPYVPRHTSPQQTSLLRKVLVTLSFYASGSYQRMMGRSVDCSVSQTSVSRFVREITMALNHPQILTRFIRFPMTREERAPIIQRNFEMLGMPRVLGYIDGFLVRLTQLPHDNERQAFFCRKNFTALNVQIICDATLRILNIDARFPGSVNDHLIWGVSAARNIMEQAYWEDRCWLLGDSGYHTAPWMHVPLPHALPGTPEYYYTQLHCHCRNCVERCIGLLKARFRLFSQDRGINYGDALYAACMLNAGAVLHNYCHGMRLEGELDPLIEPELPVDYPVDNELPQDIQQRGIAERNFLINFAYARRINRDNVVNAL